MLYNTCYITYSELLYNIHVWLYNIQDGYITHPNLPDATGGGSDLQSQMVHGGPSPSIAWPRIGTRMLGAARGEGVAREWNRVGIVGGIE